MYILILNQHSESIFDFRKWLNWKYANRCICVISVSSRFKVKKWFQKQIWNENVHITIFFVFVFVLKCFTQKIDFPLYFLKNDLTGVEYIFAKLNSEKAKLPKITLSFGVSMLEAQIKHCLLTPPLPLVIMKTNTFSKSMTAERWNRILHLSAALLMMFL